MNFSFLTSSLWRHPLNPVSWLRALYDLCMKWTSHAHGAWVLSTLAFLESIFMPLPVDPFLIAMSAGKPKKSIHYATVCIVASVLGGAVAYSIGMNFSESVSEYFSSGHYATQYPKAVQLFKENTTFAMFVAGLTFLPFKVFTFTAGVLVVPFNDFLLGSLLGRLVRFYLLGIPLYFWGVPIKHFIDKYFNVIAIFIILVVLVVILTFK